MADGFTIDRSIGIGVISDLTVPGCNDLSPIPRSGGHEQVLTHFVVAKHATAGWAMSHGAGVNPSLSTGRCLLAPVHLEHVSSSWRNRSPEGVVLVKDLSLNYCAVWAHL